MSVLTEPSVAARGIFVFFRVFRGLKKYHTFIHFRFSNAPFSNCLRQNAMGQFNSVSNSVSAMSYETPGQQVAKKIPA